MLKLFRARIDAIHLFVDREVTGIVTRVVLLINRMSISVVQTERKFRNTW